MITYRLADSLPQSVLKNIDTLDEEKDLERRQHIESYLDNGLGRCELQETDVAKIVIENWLYWNHKKYELLNFVVMPNHVHLLIKQLEGHTLESILHSWKSFTSVAINKILHKSGAFWSPEYWDRYIRDESHFKNANHYINNNPVKARLVAQPEDWEYIGLHYL